MTRCSACPTDIDGRPCSRPVLAITPTGRDHSGCDILFLGAGPGKTESRTLRPYTGLAGDELRDLYIPLTDYHVDEVAIGNVTLCWDGTDKPPSAKRVLVCAQSHLPELLARVNPTVVVLMGGATQAICDKRIRLDVHHGMPVYTSLLNGVWSGWVWPEYEPALGMRDTTMMTPLIDDFKRLGKWLRGEWLMPVVNDEPTDYEICQDADDFLNYVDCMEACLEIACDTESHGGELWSIQISHTPDTGRMLRVDNLEVIDAFRQWSKVTSATWIFHFAQHDLDELHKIDVEVKDFRDTMQEAYHLCSLPQGLKALVYRLFGYEMKSWEDVVWPASVEVVKEWLDRGIAHEALRPIITETQLTMGKCVACGKRNKRAVCNACGGDVDYLKREESPNAVESVLRHILRYTESTEEHEEPYNPWKKLPEMRESGLRGKVGTGEEWQALIDDVGELPVLGIGNCDIDEAVQYGCGDSDWTLRVAGKLAELRQDKRWKIDEADYDE